MPPIDITEGLSELIALEDERTAKWERVLLLGDPATVEAGRAWHRTIWTLQDFAHGLRTDKEEWQKALIKSVAARETFYARARAQLGIPGELPEPGVEPRGSTKPFP
jgi:hypothetical protein